MPIVERYEKNPILTKNDIPYPVVTVHNAGVCKYEDRYIMIFRSHRDNGRSILGIAESEDGFTFHSSDKPFMTPAQEGIFKEYEEYGIEDPRITYNRWKVPDNLQRLFQVRCSDWTGKDEGF